MSSSRPLDLQAGSCAGRCGSEFRCHVGNFARTRHTIINCRQLATHKVVRPALVIPCPMSAPKCPKFLPESGLMKEEVSNPKTRRPI